MVIVPVSPTPFPRHYKPKRKKIKIHLTLSLTRTLIFHTGLPSLCHSTSLPTLRRRDTHTPTVDSGFLFERFTVVSTDNEPREVRGVITTILSSRVDVNTYKQQLRVTFLFRKVYKLVVCFRKFVYPVEAHLTTLEDPEYPTNDTTPLRPHGTWVSNSYTYTTPILFSIILVWFSYTELPSPI